MPRQRTHYNRRAYVFPDDFPQRLVWFKHASGLPWAEIARRLGISPMTIRRWWKAGIRPQLPASECVAEPGRRPGSCPPVQRVRKQPATAGP